MYFDLQQVVFTFRRTRCMVEVVKRDPLRDDALRGIIGRSGEVEEAIWFPLTFCLDVVRCVMVERRSRQRCEVPQRANGDVPMRHDRVFERCG